MKRELEFLNDLQYSDVMVIPFIELFQKNEELRNELFQQYLKTETSKDEISEEFHKHSIRRTPLFNKLKEIDADITDFNLFVQKNRDYNAKNEAEIIVEDIISKLEAIGLQYLTELVLKYFVKQQKRNFKRLEMLNEHSYDADKAKTHYRHLARYANKVVEDYLIALPPQTTKEAEQEAVEQFEKSNKVLPPQIINEPEQNNFLLSTIEDYLEPIKDKFKEDSYKLLINELYSYFTVGNFTNSKEAISVIGKGNLKKIGWQLKELYRNCKDDNSKLPIEYLKFGKERISIFKNTKFDENNYLKSNLYKYYTNKQ